MPVIYYILSKVKVCYTLDVSSYWDLTAQPQLTCILKEAQTPEAADITDLAIYSESNQKLQ